LHLIPVGALNVDIPIRLGILFFLRVPPRDRKGHLFEADSEKYCNIVAYAIRVSLLLLLLVRGRTRANTVSITLVERTSCWCFRLETFRRTLMIGSERIGDLDTTNELGCCQRKINVRLPPVALESGALSEDTV
jgi:hypothetical protein